MGIRVSPPRGFVPGSALDDPLYDRDCANLNVPPGLAYSSSRLSRVSAIEFFSLLLFFCFFRLFYSRDLLRLAQFFITDPSSSFFSFLFLQVTGGTAMRSAADKDSI